ncbi:sugar phosphate isomerase/epimerase family protein [Paenibacillus aceris]|uniref:Sugar phosphate isomerase/epimerase n=1 Tax=Paenibacillus aceris TaxID=869555 RepID=A0ABS4I5T8_9BACL|nr:sugar phosphate isomerase/epimerase family protein [Paenibacillus aceris]MBP1966188.1 sugar phosphate isomerase/epimerase [Paenibacillus aceris]NHW33343.1 sugar phosphate isomerase/epimerase [Paenibacillus aceris]
MKLSTSLNVFNNSVTRNDAIRRCAAAGFEVLDMNYWDLQSQMLQVSWSEEETWAKEIRTLADQCGVRFTQMHGPVHGGAFANLVPGLTLDSFVGLAERSLRTAAILGIPWVVFHPSDIAKDGEEAFQEVLDFNVNFYSRLIPVLEETGVGIALENTCYVQGCNRFFTVAEELVQLIDILDHRLIGACWDTGHAHVHKIDHASAFRLLGSRLKATHIHDNDGVKDQHLLPYQGTIDWTRLVGTLKEIQYSGDFTYEAHNGVNKLPDAIRDAGLKFAYELGNYVISLGKEKEERRRIKCES